MFLNNLLDAWARDSAATVKGFGSLLISEEAALVFFPLPMSCLASAALLSMWGVGEATKISLLISISIWLFHALVVVFFTYYTLLFSLFLLIPLAFLLGHLLYNTIAEALGFRRKKKIQKIYPSSEKFLIAGNVFGTISNTARVKDWKNPFVSSSVPFINTVEIIDTDSGFVKYRYIKRGSDSAHAPYGETKTDDGAYTTSNWNFLDKFSFTGRNLLCEFKD